MLVFWLLCHACAADAAAAGVHAAAWPAVQCADAAAV
jgi:hypothetical protein